MKASLSIITTIVLMILATYSSANTLVVTTTANDGVGSLREKTKIAQSGDTITFASSIDTIQLTDTIVLNVSVAIIGNATTPTVINGQDSAGIFIVGFITELYLEHLQFINGNAAKGGAIDNNGAITVNNCSFLNNKSGQGGAIINNGKATIRNSQFTNNIAIYGNQQGGAIRGGDFSDTLRIDNVTFAANKAGHGGGIYASNNKVFIANSSFISDSASTEGGAVYFSDGILFINNTSFTSNYSVGDGGAIYILKSSTISLTNTQLTNNKTDAGGGGLVLFLSNNITLSSCTFERDSAKGTDGGAILLIDQNILTATDCQINKNFANSKGGGIYLSLINTMTLQNSQLHQNYAVKSGGAIQGQTVNHVTIKKTTLKYNRGEEGGAIYSTTLNTFDIDSCMLTGNIALVSGGAIFQTGQLDTLILKNSTLDSNAAIQEGGGAIKSESFALLYNTILSNNLCAARGGGIFNSGLLKMDSCLYLKNHSNNRAGAIYNKGRVEATLTTLDSNSAVAIGGGIYNEFGGGEVVFTNSTINNNVACRSGGGFFNEEKITLLNCYIQGNMLTANNCQGFLIGGAGGASFLGDNILTNCVISGNFIAPGGFNFFGGGLYLRDANSAITNTTITGNSPSGIALPLFGFDTLYIQNSIIWGNDTSFINFNFMVDSIAINHSIIEDFIDSFPNSGNISLDPDFISPILSSQAPTTLGNYALSNCSPALDAGSQDTLDLFLPSLDIRGKNRLDGIIDMGAFENRRPFITTPQGLTFCQGDSILLTANGAGAGESYQWFLDSSFLFANANASQFFQINGSVSMKVLCNNGTTSPFSDSVNIIKTQPPNTARVVTPNGLEICDVGELIILGDTIAPDEKYNWFKDGQLLADTTPFIVATSSGTYVLLISDTTCTSPNSDTVNIVNGDIKTPTLSQPYFENFEQGSAGWKSHRKTPTNTDDWVLASPLGTANILLEPENGQHIWVTALDTVISKKSNAWVISPCFDLTELQYPMISLRIFSHSEEAIDGAVLQYKEDADTAWITIGKDDDKGLNWYNEDLIVANPGNQAGQKYGWTGIDYTWKTARYSLFEVFNKTGIKFRVAYATDDNNLDKEEGFAFDNVWIGERNRLVLVEHFTDLNSPADIVSNNLLYDRFNAFPNNLIPIQYHTDDGLYAYNPSDINARMLRYSISSSIQPAYDVVDGDFYNDNSLQNNTLGWTEADFYERWLTPALFNIDISKIVNNNQLQVTATVTLDTTAKDAFLPTEVNAITQALDDEDLVFYIAVVEDSVTANGHLLRNVFRHYLPNAGGTVLEFPSQSFSENILLDTSLINLEQVQIVAFIQNRLTNEIMQVATSAPELSVNTTTPTIASSQNVVVFPNPTTGAFTIEYQQPTTQHQYWQFQFLDGRILQQGILSAGQRQYHLNLKNTPTGMYLLSIVNEQGNVVTKKVVVY